MWLSKTRDKIVVIIAIAIFILVLLLSLRGCFVQPEDGIPEVEGPWHDSEFAFPNYMVSAENNQFIGTLHNNFKSDLVNVTVMLDDIPLDCGQNYLLPRQALNCTGAYSCMPGEKYSFIVNITYVDDFSGQEFFYLNGSK
jgi:hypothetical protein